jgi:hypothetical protein
MWIALWAAIRLERRLGLTPAPTRNAPVARPPTDITDAGTCLPRDGPVLTSLRPGQLTVDPACLPDRRGPLRSLRHHPSLTRDGFLPGEENPGQCWTQTQGEQGRR